MLDTMARGGPDDQGLHQSGFVTLGHRRLSIIDLSPAGHQPMVGSGGIVVSFNGEIYNYKELRLELERLGTRFKTSSDTEVIIEAYLQWKEESFQRLSGMFALIIHDTARQVVYAVRDAHGVKPLYAGWRNGDIVFASEVKAFRAFDPKWPDNPNWRIMFLTFGYLPPPITNLQNVRAIAKGCYLKIDLNQSWVDPLEFNYTGKYSYHLSSPDPIESVRKATDNALKRHLVADVPIGVFLSGGIDSSILTLLAHREVGRNLRTVSVNFKEATYDESKYQDIVLATTGREQHSSYRVDYNLLRDSMPDVWFAMDQPTIDGVNSYFVSKYAHDCGLKAVLSGLGADELFGGYKSFHRVRWLHILRSTNAKLVADILRRWKDPYARLAFLAINGPVGDYLFLRGIHTPSSVAQVLSINESSIWDVLHSYGNSFTKKSNDDAYASSLERDFYMTGQLLKDADFMSMHFGLEVRVPFLDQELTWTVDNLPATARVENDRPKHLLTTAFKGLVPEEIVFRKKQGFTFPFALWLKESIASQNDGDSFGKGDARSKDLFMNGKVHWTKYWSTVVLSRF